MSGRRYQDVIADAERAIAIAGVMAGLVAGYVGAAAIMESFEASNAVESPTVVTVATRKGCETGFVCCPFIRAFPLLGASFF